MFSRIKGISASPNVHQYNVPPDVTFAGITTTAQAAILNAVGNFELCNAYTTTVGF